MLALFKRAEPAPKSKSCDRVPAYVVSEEAVAPGQPPPLVASSPVKMTPQFQAPRTAAVALRALAANKDSSSKSPSRSSSPVSGSTSSATQERAPKQDSGEGSKHRANVGQEGPLDGADGSKNEPSSSSSHTPASWALWFRGSNAQMAVSGTESQSKPRHVDLEKEPQPSSVQAKKPNLVVPLVDEALQHHSRTESLKSSLKSFSGYFLGSSDERQHTPLLTTSPKRLKRVVVIGVHGFFPGRLVRSILGEPTGTSVKFANEAADAVRRWALDQGYRDDEVTIDKIALEGHGVVSRRVDRLYELLANWVDVISRADFVWLVAHSQGTPVAVHLLARLVQDKIVDSQKAKLAILAMAGVSLGPMPGLDKTLVLRAYSSIESQALTELFSFQSLVSPQSVRYLDDLDTVLAQNTKIVFTGSVNDQLVPLYSATAQHISHPNIFRAAYVDGTDVAPEFVSTLLGLALSLRNAGLPDHGVVKELSPALAGTLTGGGHSKMYDEPLVYDEALRFVLHTTDTARQPLKVDRDYQVPLTTNPYILPWSMHGMLSEARTRAQYGKVLGRLYEEFEAWHPESKVLRDVKYRLSGIQAKL